MTVPYDDRLSRLFFRWKASVWKLVWRDLLAFCVLYAGVSLLYRFGLSSNQRITFEQVVNNIGAVCDSLVGTVSFLLGFFVSANVTRWWTQFELLPWPEELMNAVNFAMPDQDDEMHLVRRTIARYFCLTTALAGRLLSTSMLNRFPSEHDIIKTGLMTEAELAIYKNTAAEVKSFIPMIWMQRIIGIQARKRDVPAPHSNHIEKEVSECITRFRKLFCYDWVNIPLVYTQCVAFATYVYFCACVIGKQFTTPSTSNSTLPCCKDVSKTNVDYYVPVFTILQLVFYMGWFHVGLKLMKPFGDDDEDFEVNTLLDRHIEVAFELADAPMKSLPKLQHLYPIQSKINETKQDAGFLNLRSTAAELRDKLRGGRESSNSKDTLFTKANGTVTPTYNERESM